MITVTRLVKGGVHRLRRLAGRCGSLLADAQLRATNILPGKNSGLVIIDDFFPSLATGFRISEFNCILSSFSDAIIYSTNPDRVAFSEYSAAYPEFHDRVRRFHRLRRLRGRAAYVVFLNNIYQHVELLEKWSLPFIFELYPGGGFYLNDSTSDAHLSRVLTSPMFRKVIVTQSTTRNYLLNNKFCRDTQIEFIFGVVAPFDIVKNGSDQKRHYGLDKKSLDICFVANKYMAGGLDKGFDRFVASARLLAKRYPHARFHVVGNFDEHDAEMADLRDRFTFYGHRPPTFFPEFHSRMDLILSPNVPSVFTQGAFDGFPTGCCIDAAICGTSLFATDELGMNEGRFKDGEDIAIISRRPDEIAERVAEYVNDPQRLASLGESGRRTVKRLYSFDTQMVPRLRILSNLLKDDPGTKRR